MIILGIETSAVSAGAALLVDGKIVSETYINSGLTHSQTLMCLIDTALNNAGIAFSDVNAVAVAAGPGSFTGIRIGVSAVKGLCFSENKPCFPVSTLEALANCAALEEYVICPVMDARCKQVYTAMFEMKEGHVERIKEDMPLSVDDLSNELLRMNRKVLLVGDGTDVTYGTLVANGVDVVKFPEVFKYQRACGVAIAAFKRYNKGETGISADKLVPSYLRLSQAERELKNRSCEK